MKAALALILIVPCLAQVLPRQMVPGRNSGRPVPANGVIEAVQVDAVAVDPSGRPVTGLSAQDFEVLHDGRAQKVEKVEFVDTHERRTMVLVVDDLGLTLAHMRQVKWAIRKFVDEQMQPEDRVSILRTSGGTGALQQLTSDRTLLVDAAEGLQFCPWSRAESGAEAKEQALALSLGTVRHAIDYLREEPGRKAVVLISENLRERAATPRGMPLAAAFDDLAKMADVGSVVFYAIDPRGLEYQPAAPPSEGKQAPVISLSSNATRAPESGLMILARDTGGMIVDRNNDAAAGMTRVLQALAGYYVITYQPDAASFILATGERKFERLTVKTHRPGLMVRARNGLLPVPAKPDDDDRLISLEGDWRTRAIGSPFASGGIRMQVTPVFGNSADGGSYVEAFIHVDVRDLTFLQGLNGLRTTTLDVVLAGYRGTGVNRCGSGQRRSDQIPGGVLRACDAGRPGLCAPNAVPQAWSIPVHRGRSGRYQRPDGSEQPVRRSARYREGRLVDVGDIHSGRTA